MKQIIAYAAGLLLSASCAPMKEAAELLTIPQQYASETPDTNTIATLSRNNFFHDKELAGYIDQAVARNFDVLTALKNVEMARQELRQARIDWLPELGISAQASHTRATDREVNSGMERRQNSYSLPLQFSWEIDIWGKIHNTKQAARADYLQSAEAQRAVLSSVVAEVANTYYNILMLNRQQEIVVQNAGLNDTVLNMLRVQYEFGNENLASVQQAEAQNRATNLQRLQIEQELKIQQNVLALLTGQSRLTNSAFITGFNRSEHPDTLHSGIPAQLLQYRPDVKASEFTLQAANARLGIARKNFYPTLTLTAQSGLSESNLSDLFSVNKALFGVIDGALYQPLFKRGRLKKDFALARLTKEKAEIAFQQSFTTACVEVSNALIQTANFHDQQVEARQRTLTLEMAVNNSRLLYSNGSLSYIGVLTLQRDLLQSQLEQASIANQRLQAETTLYRALGGGWE